MSATRCGAWSAGAASAACRSNSCARTRATRASHFAESELDELAASIRERGIIQPIVVRPAAGRAGRLRDRRRRAALARRAASPACTTCRSSWSRSATTTSLEYAILENVQRADLNPIEEAQGYHALMAEFNVHAGRSRQDHRQEPQPCRQHDAACRICPRAVQDAVWSTGRSPPAMPARCSSVQDPQAVAQADRRAGPERPRGRGDRPGRQTMPRKARSQVGAQSIQKDPDTRALETGAPGRARA